MYLNLRLVYLNNRRRQFICGTLAMGISIAHMLVDCASCVELIKEWARVSRGDSKSDPLAITSWDRQPRKFFPLSTPTAIPEDGRPAKVPGAPPPHPREKMMSNFFFTRESLRELKKVCTPAGSDDWVSTGDCVAAVAWRASALARKALLEPGCDIHLIVAADGRSRSKIQPDASKYFGNLVMYMGSTSRISRILLT
jgi:Transferase family